MLKVFVPKERRAGETRVAFTPDTVKKLVKEKVDVLVEAGAGLAASHLDKTYEAAGAKIVTDMPGVKDAWATSDIVLKVTEAAENPDLGKHEADALKPGAILVGLMSPHRNVDMVKRLLTNKVSTLALELVPRITRAQSMDVLSSQANIAGYKAVLLAAANLPKYFPLLMTAAGTIQPARVVIMGAGVAGLQAIATAKRLGAVVEVSDIRPAVKEQVQSLGGKFIELPNLESGEGQGGYAKEMSAEFIAKQQEILSARIAQADVVITTALIPGRPAPKLVTAAMVERMKPGSVIIDLAVEQGGNCELSELNKTVIKHGVKIIGESNLAASLATDASTLFARNVLSLLMLFAKGGELKLDLNDEVIKGTLLTHDGEIIHGPTKDAISKL
ncbi:MAG TPA: Re/Si-specific NAD(P)(+) transhydrogenase subunit alpha [Polyangiales bacterium]|nr:Re/Si-specific NAD(P)(+) transhydrogenase subunit alpha [Polyangiales bacterium]